MNFGHEKCWYIFVRLWRLDGWTAEVAFRFLAKGAPYLAIAELIHTLEPPLANPARRALVKDGFGDLVGGGDAADRDAEVSVQPLPEQPTPKQGEGRREKMCVGPHSISKQW